MADKTTRQIRKVRREKAQDFDDQLWPINVAILILAGFVVGVILATSNFHEPRILFNGWTHLIGVTIWVALLFWAVFLFQGKVVRRVQLCVVISLLIHLCLAIWLANRYLEVILLEEEENPTVTEEYQQITIPDYVLDPERERPEESLDEPIEYEAPRPQDPQAVKTEVPPEPEPVVQKPVEQQPERDPQQPNPREIERVELTAPRRADTAAGATVSRQIARDVPKPNRPITDPQLNDSPRAAKASNQPSSASHQPTQTQQVRTSQEQTTPSQPAATQLATTPPQPTRRVEQQTPVNNRTTTPQPNRSTVRPSTELRTEATTPQPQQVTTRPVQAPQMRSTESARREAANPSRVAPQQAAEAQPTPDRAVAATAQRAAPERPMTPTERTAVERNITRPVTQPTPAAQPAPETLAQNTPQPSTAPPITQAQHRESSVTTPPRTVQTPTQPNPTPAPTSQAELAATAPVNRTVPMRSPVPPTTQPTRPAPTRTATAVEQPIASNRPVTPSTTRAPAPSQTVTTPAQASRTATRTAAAAPNQVTQQSQAVAQATQAQAAAATAVRRTQAPTPQRPAPSVQRTSPTRTIQSSSTVARTSPSAPATAQPQANAQSSPAASAQASTQAARTSTSRAATNTAQQAAAAITDSRANNRNVASAARRTPTTDTSVAQSAPAHGSSPSRATMTAQAAPAAAQPLSSPAPTAQASSPSNPATSVSQSTAAARDSANRLAATSQMQPAGQAIPRVTQTAQLPATAASRRAPSSSMQAASTSVSNPTTPNRSDQGAKLPSSALAASQAPAAVAASPGSMASSPIPKASAAAVRQATSGAPRSNNTAAAGAAETAVGASQAVARQGQQRSIQSGVASAAAATGAAPQPARVPGRAATIGSAAIADASAPRAPTSEAGASAAQSPALNPSTAAAKPGGDVRPMAVAQNQAGAGPAAETGTSGPVRTPVERMITRYESSAATFAAGGGTPRPARAPGQTTAPNINVQAQQSSAPSVANQSNDSEVPMVASSSAARAIAAGPAGSLVSQPKSGAPTSMTDRGTADPAAVARRDAAAAANPSSGEPASDRTVTLRPDSGRVDLPTIATNATDTSQPGTAGVTQAEGSLASTLTQASTSAVRDSAAAVTTNAADAATGSEAEALGTAQAVAQAGTIRRTGEQTPTVASRDTQGTPQRTARAVGQIASTIDADADPSAASPSTDAVAAAVATANSAARTDSDAPPAHSDQTAAQESFDASANADGALAAAGELRDDEDEEERQRRLAALARAAGIGAPSKTDGPTTALASVTATGPTAADAVNDATGDGIPTETVAGSAQAQGSNVAETATEQLAALDSNLSGAADGAAQNATADSRATGQSTEGAATTDPRAPSTRAVDTTGQLASSGPISVESADANATGEATDAVAQSTTVSGSTRTANDGVEASTEVAAIDGGISASSDATGGPQSLAASERLTDNSATAARQIATGGSIGREVAAPVTTLATNRIAMSGSQEMTGETTGPDVPTTTVGGSAQGTLASLDAQTEIGAIRTGSETGEAAPTLAASGGSARRSVEPTTATGVATRSISRLTGQMASLATGAVDINTSGGPSGEPSQAAEIALNNVGGTASANSSNQQLTSASAGAIDTPAGDVPGAAVASNTNVTRPDRPGTSDLASSAGSATATRRPLGPPGIRSTPIATIANSPSTDTGEPSDPTQPTGTGNSPGPGEPSDQAIAIAMTGPTSQTAGPIGPIVEAPAIELAETGPTASGPSTATGQLRYQRSDEPGPTPALSSAGSGPSRMIDRPGLPLTSVAINDTQVENASNDGGSEFEVQIARGDGIPSPLEGGLPVQIAANIGPGGLSYEESTEVGLPSRQARRMSEVVHNVSRRFVIERTGGEVTIDKRIAVATDAYSHRDPGRRAQSQRIHGAAAGTEESIEAGLDFLARHQFPDGHWSINELPPGVDYENPGLATNGMSSDTAATGLALLTYLGGGYDHLSDKYRSVVRRGVQWLIKNQADDGDLFIKNGGNDFCHFYSHGIATIALCESYGLTQDSMLREPARKAVDFIVRTQQKFNPETGRGGGWRYRIDPQTGRSSESDTSVTGWQLMALKSAQMAGFDVPQETFDQIKAWLKTAQIQEKPGTYAYNPFAANDDRQRHGRLPSRTMTAEAMLMLMYMGERRDAPGMAEGADYIIEAPPQLGGQTEETMRNSYYWYYASQAMFQMQGDYWTRWNERFREVADATQIKEGQAAGSWHPLSPTPDRWGQHGGRLTVTALHLLMLEVDYRILPLFQDLGD